MKRGYDTYHNSGVEWLADIPGHWGLTRLGMALSDSVAGGTPNTSADHYWAESDEDGMPWVAIGDMSDGGIVDCTEKSVTEAGLMDARLQPLPPGTIVYSMYASVGAVAVLGITAVTNQAILGLIPSNDVESPYLYWWLHALRSPVSALTRSNTQANLNADTVHRFPILVPPLEEQEQIGAYLDRETARIDKLITMQESLIERLDEYRTALITRVVTKGLPPEAAEVAGLDPAPVLRDSGVAWLGAVPEHWDVCQLRRAFSIANGGTPATSDYGNWDGEIAWLTPDDLGRHEGKSISEGRRSITPQGLQSSGARLSPPGSVVLSTRAPIGHLAVTARPAATNQGCRTLVPTAGVVSGFAYYSLLASREVLQATGKGSTFMELSATDLAQHWLPQPPPNEQQVVSNFLDSRSQRIDALQAKAELSIERLGEYRSAVVSAAVTGKIDVRDEALAGVGGGV
ncbi:MAG: hypothetical protein F4Y47_06530 [Acidobacteriia bacterium]|nr:hypothetical protein [Terriglobia bacterium]